MTYLFTLLKGMAMGAANVIPGVSGGTIALVTGIYERLIHSIKSFDLTAARHLLRGNVRAFLAHTNFYFVLAVFGGAIISIVSLAKLLRHLFEAYPELLWSFFFGLILASVFSVGRTIARWNLPVVIAFLAGTTVAVSIAFLTPAAENSTPVYVFICGIIAICSMILPGLSGSFILIIMGNYLLILSAISDFQLDVLVPLGLGCVVGLVAFAHLLSWVFRNFRNVTISLMTGFILGSLLILWPWKEAVYLKDDAGMFVLRKGEQIVSGYEYLLPEAMNTQTLLAFGFMVFGALTILGMEYLSKRYKKDESI